MDKEAKLEHVHEYGWVGAPIKGEAQKKLLEIGKKIEKDDLYIEDEDDGLEEDSHVTILFGIHDGQNPKVEELLQSNYEVDGKLVKLDLFKNEKYDVLIVKVESEGLANLNKILKDNLDYTNDYPDYKAHATIAHLKSGTGKKYIDGFKPINYTFSEIEYENSDSTFVKKFILKRNDIDSMLKGI